MRSEQNAILSSGLARAQIWQFHGSGMLSEVKQEAEPLPWHNMNRWGEASSVYNYTITTAVVRDEHACMSM